MNMTILVLMSVKASNVGFIMMAGSKKTKRVVLANFY